MEGVDDDSELVEELARCEGGVLIGEEIDV